MRAAPGSRVRSWRAAGGENPTGVRGDADFGLARFEEAVQLDATTLAGSCRSRAPASPVVSRCPAPSSARRRTSIASAVAETFALDGRDPFDSTLEAATADASVSFRNATFGGDVELGGGGSAGVGRHWCPSGRPARLAQRSGRRRRGTRSHHCGRPGCHRAGGRRAHVANRHVRAAGPVRERGSSISPTCAPNR